MTTDRECHPTADSSPLLEGRNAHTVTHTGLLTTQPSHYIVLVDFLASYTAPGFRLVSCISPAMLQRPSLHEVAKP
jgi:hypothetical protein